MEVLPCNIHVWHLSESLASCITLACAPTLNDLLMIFCTQKLYSTYEQIQTVTCRHIWIYTFFTKSKLKSQPQGF